MEGLLDVESHARELHEQELEQHVLNVASSPHFLRAETLRKLLLYLWQNRLNHVSEYAVGTEALGRRSDFDPKTDASVRVQISRLRRKLKDFYELEGIHEPAQLQIPVGTHCLVVVPMVPAALQPAAEPAMPRAETSRHSSAAAHLVVLAVWCHRAVVCTGRMAALAASRRSDSGKEQRHDCHHLLAELRPAGHAGEDHPAYTDLFHLYSGAQPARPRHRCERLRSLGSVSRSTARGPRRRARRPSTGAYTVTSDTLAAINLGRYLDRVGLGQDVSFEVTADRSMDLLEQASVVAFGAHATLHPFRDYLASMNFTVSEGEASVDNAHPLPGEQKQYLLSKPGVGVTMEPALVAVLPGRSKGKKLIILQARHTSALIELLTSRVGDEMVQRMYRQHGSPEFFEMVVQSEIAGDHAVRCWPVAMHAYTKAAPDGDVTQ